MDYLTLSLATWILLLITNGLRNYSITTPTVLTRFINAKGANLRMFGGIWWLLIGAPIAAWFAVQFFFSSAYQINLSTIITTLQTFSGPGLPYVLLFLVLWIVFALGYFGAGKIYKRGSK